jgi:DNA repair protein RecN (Recombination protein N)
VLEEMRIAGLGVIDDALLEFGRGLSVVTGETGAGKTMVVSGLALLMGARADSGLVRAGAIRAAVDGRFRIDPTGPLAQRVAELGGALDEDGTLLVSRTVGADGRSRAHVGGRSAPVGVLAELAEALVTVHGQADQLRLLKPSVQRELLDTYAGPAVLEPLVAYANTYARHRDVRAVLVELTTRSRERAQETDVLRFGVTEIESAALRPGEDIALDAEIERMSHVDALLTAASTARAALFDDTDSGDGADAMTSITAARRALEAAGDHDVRLAELARRVAEAGFLIVDAGTELASYVDSLEADPRRLEVAQERKAVISRLTRKYDDGAGGVAGVLAWAQAARERLVELDDGDDRRTRLAEERDQLAGEMAALAATISTARQTAATNLAHAVAEELAALAMPDATLTVAVSQAVLDADAPEGLHVGGQRLAYGPAGVDDIEIRLAAHTGAPARPLQRAASGGELSRVMLALEVVLGGADPVPTFVFDEIDAGVGGRAAVEVGQRLARLATSSQVIVVTHLPQVAAYADTHLVVEKAASDSVTQSGVTSVEGDDRVAELSRMLAGLSESELARGHAEELLAAAAAHRSDRSG